jgi:nitrogen fixation NifU-like protein
LKSKCIGRKEAESMASDSGNTDETTTYSGPVLFYNEIVIDHFTNPRNVGDLTPQNTDGYALVGDPSCGDQMKLWITVKSGRIADIAFRSVGCPGAIATSSMLTVLAKGKPIDDARRITDDDVVDALRGIPEKKRHCSLLGVQALHAAIEDFEKRQGRLASWRGSRRPK